MRAVSSAGSEHLPYKQGVTGSNPVPPTRKKDSRMAVFFYLFLGLGPMKWVYPIWIPMRSRTFVARETLR